MCKNMKIGEICTLHVIQGNVLFEINLLVKYFFEIFPVEIHYIFSYICAIVQFIFTILKILCHMYC